MKIVFITFDLYYIYLLKFEIIFKKRLNKNIQNYNDEKDSLNSKFLL